METVEISIERRSGTGKGPARRLRASGQVPAILYGPKRSTISVQVPREQFERRIAHLEGSHLIRLLHAGGGDAELHEKMVLVRDMQVHPVSGRVLHADFYEVDLTERLTVSVPLHFVGKPVGVVNGGIMQPILREIDVECLPTEIPEFIEIDVTPLAIHEAVHVADLKLPEGVSAVGDPTQTLVTVLPPSVEAKPSEATEAAGAAAAAPAAGAGDAAKKGGGESSGG